MEVKQIYELMNNVTTEILGKSDLISEDLTNVVDLGTEILNANAVDNYVQSLVNHIGKVVFVNRPYSGKIPGVLMDAWEFGSVLEKISADIPEATENETWDLQDRAEYKQDIFYKPSVSAKFFNSKVTFEVPISITERQVKESFSNAAQLNGFLSMIYNAVDKSMTIKMDALIMRTINNMIAVVAESNNYAPNRCVIDLLTGYNTLNNANLTADNAIFNKDFIRYATYIISLYSDRLGSISTLFNLGGKERFTSKENLHIVLLSDFANAAKTFLYSDTFNNEFVKLPNAETVPYWQASGDEYDSTAKIDTVVKNFSAAKSHVCANVLGVMFDRDALGVCNLNRRVTTNYNAKAEFFNNYYKFEAGYFNDTNENFVVFTLGAPVVSEIA